MSRTSELSAVAEKPSDAASVTLNGQAEDLSSTNGNSEPTTKRAAVGDAREVRHVNGNSISNGSSAPKPEERSKRRVALKRGPDSIDANSILPGSSGPLFYHPKDLPSTSAAAHTSEAGPSSSGSSSHSKVRQVKFQVPAINDEEDDDDEKEGGDEDLTSGTDEASAVLQAKVTALETKYPNMFVKVDDVVCMRLVRREADAAVNADGNGVCFKPAWGDVHLGDISSLFGYTKLRVDIAYTAGWLHCFVGVTAEERVTLPTGDLELDDVMQNDKNSGETPLQKIMKYYPAGTANDLEAFKQQITEDANFVPFGTLVTEYEAAGSIGLKTRFCIYTCPITYDKFLPYFERMQTLTLWFVDGANYINPNDPGWQIYTVYEKYEIEGRVQYGLVGFCNAYNYPAFVKSTANLQRKGTVRVNGTANGSTGIEEEKTATSGPGFDDNTKVRRRIAQFLILPPFQRRGHGVRLLDSIQRDAIASPNVVGLTMEEAVPELVRMRLCVGAWLLLGLNDFSDWLAQKIEKGYVTRDDVRSQALRLKLPVDVTLKCVKMLVAKVLCAMQRDDDAVQVLQQCEVQLINKELEDAQLAERRVRLQKISIAGDDEEKH